MVSNMAEELIPIFYVADAEASAIWYARLGFEVEGRHRFADSLPLYMFLERDTIKLHLSEHKGDARPGTLVYFWVDDVDAVSAEFGEPIYEQPWGRELKLTDPDGNRLRVATRLPQD